MSVRFNNFDIDKFRMDSETGVMTVTAIARCPGVLRYSNPDGSQRVELVSPQFLRKFDDNGFPLAGKLGGIPVTLEHPPGLLRGDSAAIEQFGVGQTKPKVKVYSDGKVQVEFGSCTQ